MRIGWASLIALALVLGGGGQASAENCSPPPAWSAAAAKTGRPMAQISACLQSEAHKARTLHIPVDNATNGIVASCEVEVDRIEGAPIFFNDLSKTEAQRQALEREVMRQATAAVERYRGCAAR